MLKPKLRPGDYHLVVDGQNNVAKLYDHSGKLVPVNGSNKIPCYPHGWAGMNQRLVGGDTIEQLWQFGGVTWTQSWESVLEVKRPYGPVFIDLVDYEGKEAKYGRGGIGAHGEGEYDGTYQHRQPLRITSGCIRFHNTDIVYLAKKNEAVRKEKNVIWCTVDQPGGEGQV